MKYQCITQDLFTLPEEYYLAHCISGDFNFGKGIAVQFNKNHNMERLIKSFHRPYRWSQNGPTALQVGWIFNLVTKECYYHKPTMDSLKRALLSMKEQALERDVKYLAMPKIGCGLDGLKWSEVEKLIMEIFEDTDVNILVCEI